jgi:PAS domain S-box-containing protein
MAAPPKAQRKQGKPREGAGFDPQAVVAGSFKAAMIHKDGKIVAANDEFARFFGYVVGADMVGLSTLDLLAPSSQAIVTENIRSHRDTMQEVEAVRRDGSHFFFSAHARDLESSGPGFRLVEANPLPEGPGLAARRLEEIQKLRELDQFKTRILNMAAHELNTPLTPLRLQTHLLLSGSLGTLEARQRHAVEVLDRNVTRLGSLVQEILDVARLQGGNLKVTVTPVELAGAVREAVDSFAETARRVGVSLEIAVPQELVVGADRGRLLQILYNLISNALKFTPAGGHVLIAGRATGDRMVFEVRDSGSGLTAEQISRLFKPFSQVHDPMAITAPGTGLGLYICRGLVEAMGGHIACESAGPGHGSTFRFDLPLSHEVPVPLPVLVPAPQRGSKEALAQRLRELI